MAETLYEQFVYSDIIILASTILQTIGFIAIFVKVGKKGWHGLIPIYNEYELSRVAKRDYVGRVLILFHVLSFLLNFSLDYQLSGDPEMELLFSRILWLAEMFVSICVFMFEIRVYSGLCEVFGKKKRWIAMWAFFPG